MTLVLSTHATLKGQSFQIETRRVNSSLVYLLMLHMHCERSLHQSHAKPQYTNVTKKAPIGQGSDR